jgi:4-alpha-glucanotransferase
MRRGLRQTDAWGIDRRYQDAFGAWHDTPEETRRAVMTAMEAPEDDENGPAGEAPVLFLNPGHPTCVLVAGELQLEQGETFRTENVLPANLPLGYHTLHPDDGSAPIRVIVAPDRAFLPEALKTWGWALQLYAARSESSWGIGDLADLKRLARWSAQELNAGVLMINPLHAPTPVAPIQPSPYYPSSRRYRNPLFLRVDGASAAAEAAGRALNRERLIDRDAAFRFKMQALEEIWGRGIQDADFDAYRAREGRDLEMFAAFCTLAERHRGWWRKDWPAEYRHPSSDGVRRFIDEHSDRIRFHEWVQWLIDKQLAACSHEIAVMQDLPIGVDGGGADAWMWQDMFAQSVSVGAPPDEFNTGGQDWGLPPFIPHKLRAAAYEPFIQTIRATLRHAGGLRIDHVLGLFRLFWVPAGLGAAKGAYVRYNADELLSIVALESWRARAFVVGEDLGTVEEGVREKLQSMGVLSYRVLWFESEPPETYPEMALSAVTTHDLPTIAGLWTGSDLAAQTRIGLQPNVEGTRESRERLKKMAGLTERSTVDEVVQKTHELLSSAPSRVITASLDDVLGVEERPNMPATTNERWPNWSIALPKTIEEIEADPRVSAVAAVLARRE